MDFSAFPKIPRISKAFFCTITEKIDGSNAQIVITPYASSDVGDPSVLVIGAFPLLTMRVGSRNRWIKPGKETDNYGFAGWCLSNATELFKLGIGTHFGEWYGNGIQCGYGLKEKRLPILKA